MRAGGDDIRLVFFLVVENVTTEIVSESESLWSAVLHEDHHTTGFHFTPKTLHDQFTS